MYSWRYNSRCSLNFLGMTWTSRPGLGNLRLHILQYMKLLDIYNKDFDRTAAVPFPSGGCKPVEGGTEVPRTSAGVNLPRRRQAPRRNSVQRSAGYHPKVFGTMIAGGFSPRIGAASQGCRLGGTPGPWQLECRTPLGSHPPLGKKSLTPPGRTRVPRQNSVQPSAGSHPLLGKNGYIVRERSIR